MVRNHQQQPPFSLSYLGYLRTKIKPKWSRSEYFRTLTQQVCTWSLQWIEQLVLEIMVGNPGQMDGRTKAHHCYIPSPRRRWGNSTTAGFVDTGVFTYPFTRTNSAIKYGESGRFAKLYQLVTIVWFLQGALSMEYLEIGNPIYSASKKRSSIRSFRPLSVP